MGRNGHSDSNRIRILESRRGISAYHLPSFVSTFEYPKTEHEEKIKNPRHKWAAALAAYTFRLKPYLREIFERHREGLWNGKFGDSCSTKGDSQASDSLLRNIGSVWGMHIRHGDVQALEDVYGNRLVFSFEKYFDEAKKLAIKLSQTIENVSTKENRKTSKTVTSKQNKKKKSTIPDEKRNVYYDEDGNEYLEDDEDDDVIDAAGNRRTILDYDEVEYDTEDDYEDDDNDDDDDDDNEGKHKAVSESSTDFFVDIPKQLTLPKAIFVTSDNPLTSKLIEQQCTDASTHISSKKKKSSTKSKKKDSLSWPDGVAPRIFTVQSNDR